MGAMADLVVVALATYPRAREAAVAHEVVDVGLDGLAGDRPKKAAVSLVGGDSPLTRANIVLSGTSAEVEALDGQVLRIGEVVLAVERTGNSCRGLYAAVGHPGVVRLGDLVTLEPPGV